MPEIAEVETVRKTLLTKLLNKRIKTIKILYPNIISPKSLNIQNLVGESFTNIDRVGKWLIFKTDKYGLLSHLRMEGKFFIKDSNEDVVKHEHVIISFEDNTDLRYHDTRKFGRMILCSKQDIYSLEEIKKQGLEPNNPKLTKDYLFNKINKLNIPIKTILLDQTIISGLGNIYANEVLFKAFVNPFKKGKEISIEECNRIIVATNTIIPEAIRMGGTTIKSYTSSLGVTGMYQQNLKVHKKDGCKCPICGSLILKDRIGGRSTYYCKKCQI